MNEVDGIEPMRYIRKKFPGTKVIAISGYGEIGKQGPSYPSIAEKIGADATIAKPLEIDALISCVREVLSVDS